MRPGARVNDIPVILGTAVAVAGLMGAVALFVIRAVVAQDLRPLGGKMIELTAALSALTTTMAAQKADEREHASEIRAILGDLNTLVHRLDTRVTILEQRGK